MLCNDVPNVKFLPDNAFTASDTGLANYRPSYVKIPSLHGYMCSMPCWIIVDLGK